MGHHNAQTLSTTCPACHGRGFLPDTATQPCQGPTCTAGATHAITPTHLLPHAPLWEYVHPLATLNRLLVVDQHLMAAAAPSTKGMDELPLPGKEHNHEQRAPSGRCYLLA